MLGHELFYITAFPFIVWNVDPAMGRRVVLLWMWSMYLGQGLKDQLKVGWAMRRGCAECRSCRVRRTCRARWWCWMNRRQHAVLLAIVRR